MPIDSGVEIALIVAVSSVISPLVLSILNNRSRRAEKLEDYARQDAVAAKAEEAAKLLLERQKVTASEAATVARKLLDANDRVADAAKVAVETAQVTNTKLDLIHTLVNSNMTTAMKSEFDAVVRELAMMREVVILNKAAGREPSLDTLAAIKSTEGKITELRAVLSDRKTTH
jgi:hypothetical protein